MVSKMKKMPYEDADFSFLEKTSYDDEFIINNFRFDYVTRTTKQSTLDDAKNFDFSYLDKVWEPID